ncbi:HIRAN domain-containing protein [Sphingomonas sp. QA11]|uniref:HIRAN domain-containing protein n=1 Tax=Sphingomonas sp. QA11 TaxID=2950605 RepID=UPI00234B182E|nr:HIRAN domain-containing protein [Sphingomonas sp. QA11]WCM29177.1 HIRAN domain-containing protein [Sphingomonas sp. QA11]
MMRELSLAVVGLDFANRDKSNRRFELALIRPGETVHLVPEPNNPADPRAVAVISAHGVQLGYLTAERCGLIGGRIAMGESFTAIFQEARRHTAIIRVRFGGGEPVLPAPRLEAEIDPDFFADPEGPDWGA